MPRVHEVAKELGLSSREVMAELNELGHPVTSHASSIDANTAARLKARLDDDSSSDGSGDSPRDEDVSDASVATGDSSAEPEVHGPEQWGGTPTSVLERPAAEDGGEPAGPAAAEQPAAEKKADRTGRGRSKFVRQLLEIPVLVVLAFIIAIIIKTFLAQAFYIPSPSMRPTLVQGDRVLVEKISYRFGKPGRGHVVVFAREVFGAPQDLPWQEDARNFLRELLGLPTGAQEDYIKRIVAVGGDVVRYAGKPRRLVVNGDEVDEPYVRGGRDRNSQTLTGRDCDRLDMDSKNRGCIIPAGTVFVMGDNRPNSEDSRVIGPIPEDKVVGRAFVVVWPFRNWGGL